MMMTQIRTMGPTEARLLNRLAANGHTVFTTDQARAVLNIDDQDINKILYQLTRKRWLLRLEKGKYLILPLEAGMEGLYSVHEFVIAARLVHPGAIAYASALSFHELSDLLPQVVLVATTRRKADVTIEELGVRFRFITIRAHKFFGLQTVMIDDQPIQITRPSKTLVDGLDHPELSGGIVELAKSLSRYTQVGADWAQLTADACRLGNRTVFKRLGYLSEILELDVGEWAGRWRTEMSPGETVLDPRYGRQGSYRTDLNLRVNVPEERLLEWRRH
jgi:predicted transcriptional regulator of viral defense system